MMIDACGSRKPLPLLQPILDYLAACDDESVTLTLAQIETIVGRPLSVTAQVQPSYWARSNFRFCAELRAMGWQAHLVVKARAVTFRRIR